MHNPSSPYSKKAAYTRNIYNRHLYLILSVVIGIVGKGSCCTYKPGP